MAVAIVGSIGMWASIVVMPAKQAEFDDLSGSYALAVWNGVGWNLLNIAIVVLILVRIGPKRQPKPVSV